MVNFLTKIIVVAFLINTLGPMPMAQADDFVLPQPGVRIGLSPAYKPSVLVGMRVDPKNPFQLNFIFDPGQKFLNDQAKRTQYRQIVEYFLASLTIPNKDMWVNLSPYEKNRIIPDNFSQTLMGRDLLSEDYLLKQMTSSLFYPEGNIGKKFWQEVYKKAQDKMGTTNIPVNTFNKVWIVPDQAEVYEKNGTVFVISSHLKVMLDEDYLSFIHHTAPGNGTQQVGTDVVRQLVIPVLEKEVNEGKNFAMLRQIYSAMLMATWFKKTLRQSILGQAYADRSKVKGINLKDTKDKERIYQEYLKAFKKGVFNFIQEDVDPLTHETIPRKYFAGGMQPYDEAMIHTANPQEIADFAQSASPLHWDSADVLLQRFLNTQVFPLEKDRQDFAGGRKIIESAEQFNKQPVLNWVPLTDHVLVIKWVKRKEQFGFNLKHQVIKRAGGPIYVYKLPRDITVQEILLLIEDMQNLPLANQEKIILPHTVRRFLQMAQILTRYQNAGEDRQTQEFITALKRIANKLGGDDISTTQDENAEQGLKEWFGINDFSNFTDVETMMARVIESGVQAVRVELEEKTFWRGENLFQRSLELEESNKQWLFHNINLSVYRDRLNQYHPGTPDADNEKIKIIQEILRIVHALPGYQTTSSLQIIEQEFPSIKLLTNRINCVGKSALVASYLNALGMKVWAVDAHALRNKYGAAEHVLLSIHLSGHRYFFADPSYEEKDSHAVTLSLEDNQIPEQGIILDLSKEQDPDFKRVYMGPWRPMITAMVYSSLGVVLLGQGDKKGAIAAHKKAIMLYPSYSSGYTNLGVALFKDGDIKNALAADERATQLNPYNSSAWVNWGEILNKRKELVGSIAKRKKAIELNPNDSITRNNLAVLLYKNGDIEGAKTQYIEAIKLDPNHTSLAYKNLRILFDQTKQYERAVEFYQEQVKLYPGSSEAQKNLEYFLGKTGKKEEVTVPGGIDFNEDLLDMHIKRDGDGVPMAMQLQDSVVSNIQGLAPVIVKIFPFDPSSIINQ